MRGAAPAPEAHGTRAATAAAETPRSPPGGTASGAAAPNTTHSAVEGSGATPTPSAAPALPPPGARLDDPDPAAIARLEDLTARRDAAGLLALFREERSILRFEALRRYLEVGGREGLAALAGEISREEDPRAHDLLGTALGASGSAREAAALAASLPSLEAPSARLAAAAAVVEIAARTDADPEARAAGGRADPGASLAAVLALEDLANGRPGLAPRACRALAQAGENGLAALERIASGAALPERSRLSAAESLLGRDPARAARPLRALAEGAADPAVRDLAGLYLERLEGR